MAIFKRILLFYCINWIILCTIGMCSGSNFSFILHSVYYCTIPLVFVLFGQIIGAFISIRATKDIKHPKSFQQGRITTSILMLLLLGISLFYKTHNAPSHAGDGIEYTFDNPSANITSAEMDRITKLAKDSLQTRYSTAEAISIKNTIILSKSDTTVSSRSNPIYHLQIHYSKGALPQLYQANISIWENNVMITDTGNNSPDASRK